MPTIVVLALSSAQESASRTELFGRLKFRKEQASYQVLFLTHMAPCILHLPDAGAPLLRAWQGKSLAPFFGPLQLEIPTLLDVRHFPQPPLPAAGYGP